MIFAGEVKDFKQELVRRRGSIFRAFLKNRKGSASSCSVMWYCWSVLLFEQENLFLVKNHRIMAAELQVLEKTYTIEEYLEFEKHLEIRHEYYYGKLLPKSGDSKRANAIAGNCEFQMRLQLRKKGLDFFRHDVRMLVREQKIYRYPDFVIAPVVDDSDSHLIKQPVLIIEVSSDNSDHTDQVTKRNEYLNLPTVEYYLIISQSERLIDVYSKDKKGWRFDSFSKEEEVIEFPSLGAKLPLADIYDELELAN